MTIKKTLTERSGACVQSNGPGASRTDENDAQAEADDVLRSRGVDDANVAGRRVAAGQFIADGAQSEQVGAETQAPDCARESSTLRAWSTMSGERSQLTCLY